MDLQRGMDDHNCCHVSLGEYEPVSTKRRRTEDKGEEGEEKDEEESWIHTLPCVTVVAALNKPLTSKSPACIVRQPEGQRKHMAAPISAEEEAASTELHVKDVYVQKRGRESLH